MTRGEKAKALFEQGYNCAQSMVLAFSDKVDMDEKTLTKLASSFGGGMGRLREVCGAVSGMFIVAGLLYGYDTPETGEIKHTHYARIQKLAGDFEKEHGSIVCRTLLGLDTVHDDAAPSPRTSEYYAKRPCGGFIEDAANILDKYIKENLPQ